MTEQQSQRYKVEPQQWANWQNAAGEYINLIRNGQAWIKTDTVVEITQ